MNRLSIVALLALCIPCIPFATQAQDEILDSIRAVVNEGVVLDSDVRQAMSFFKQQSRSSNQPIPPDDVLEQRILQQLVNQEVHQQHARVLGISINPASVNRAIDTIARNNNMDAQRFRNTLQQQGLDYNQFRQNIERELLFQQLIEREVQSRIRNSSQEIDDFVEAAKNDISAQQRYRISHILLALPADADAQQISSARTRADAVLARLNAGDDFSVVATSSSDGARALQGGDLGWRTLQELPEFIAEPIQSMAIDQISDVLTSSNGLHIIKLADQQSSNASEQAETLARHIFISGDAADIESRLQQVRQRLLSGESFKDLAASISEDPNSANNSGELPWFTQGQMPPAMEQAAETLQINGISQPFRTQFGWHLLQVLDRRVQKIDDETLRQQADIALRQRKVEQETERWSRRLRDESYVEIRS